MRALIHFYAAAGYRPQPLRHLYLPFEFFSFLLCLSSVILLAILVLPFPSVRFYV